MGQRVKVISPLAGQHLTKDEVLLVGEMKGFFESTMNIRLIDDEGNELLTDIIMPSSTVVDQFIEFASFEKYLDLGNLNFTTAKGYLEFYEESAKDGSENLLVSIQVYFK